MIKYYATLKSIYTLDTTECILDLFYSLPFSVSSGCKCTVDSKQAVQRVEADSFSVKCEA